MLTGTTLDGLAPVRKIMDRHSAQCSPDEFHRIVNIAFHDFEAEAYDSEHSDMWESLPQEFNRLAGDCSDVSERHDEFNLLDIGCGTGLGTDSLLKSSLGPKIKSVHLLDTSSAMLRQVAERARGWRIPFTIGEGLVDSVPRENKFSLIVTCSVLHHIPDLPTFLRTIRSLQPQNGIYIHLQDPNRDHLTDPEYLKRVERARSQRAISERLSRFTPKRIIARLYRELTGKQHDNYCDKTNRALLELGIISTPLSVAEIYSITDIHAVDGEGISIRDMASWMPKHELISCRSYAFFGKLWSNLSPHFKRLEEQLADERALNGLHIGAAWRTR